MAAKLQKIYNLTVIFEEAKRIAKDAIKCYLESVIKRGKPIPEDRYPYESGKRWG